MDQIIKKSFSNVKKDIEALNLRISNIESKLDEFLDILSPILEERGLKRPKAKESSSNSPKVPKNEVSTGNKGVHSFIHSSIHSQGIHSFTNHSHKEPLDTVSLKKELESRIKSLRRKEFLLFLTVYLLEDEKGRGVKYEELSKMLNNSEGNLRTNTTYIIRKGLPLVRKKLNNKVTVLTIDPSFKSLGLKQWLTNLYYSQDPDQTKLFNN